MGMWSLYTRNALHHDFKKKKRPNSAKKDFWVYKGDLQEPAKLT